MTQVAFPFRVDGRGRTAEAGEARHVRELIEQYLFTSPGERVNRPDFGSGLKQLVFAPSGPELASATQFLVQSGLQQWLGDRILIDAVEVLAEDSTLRITVQYRLRGVEGTRTDEFIRTI
jgi:phage baseplate assembly protein W